MAHSTHDIHPRRQVPASGRDAAALAGDPPILAGAAGVQPDDPLLDCLSTLSALLGKPHSRDALASGLPLGRQGCTPELFARAAERAGIRTRLAKRPLDRISPLNLPCVLLLKGGDACVLAALGPDTKADVIPSGERDARSVDLAKLAEQYTGQAIFAKLEVGPQRGQPSFLESTPSRRLGGVLLRLWPVYAHVAIASLIINLFAVASPLFIMNVYDRVVPNNALETLWVLAVGVGIVFLFDFVLRNLRAYFVDAAGKSADVIFASSLFAHVLGMSCAARPSSTGAFASNVRDYESVREFLTSATLITLIDLPFAALFIAIVYLIAGPLAWIPAIGGLSVLIVAMLIQLPLKSLVEATMREAADKHAILVESIEGLDTIKTATAEGRAQRLWESVTAKSARSSAMVRFLASLATNAVLLGGNLVIVGVVMLGVYEIAAGRMTVGSLVAATILAGRAMAPMAQTVALSVRLFHSIGSLKALNRLMSLPLERPADRSFLIRRNCLGQVEFRDVSFSYPDQTIQALDRVSFVVNPGEKVAIIGKIGSGKTTIARLIIGLYQPSQGAVLLDGTDIRQLDPAELRRHVGCAQQDPFLFTGSVRENICISTPNVDDAAILRAATIAGADDFLKRHPLGYDLPVGEHGRQISGGQRQAIALARALLFDPPVLVLDEPTSAMDNTSEARFKARLTELMAAKTLILVTHRSSMLQLVDRLIVLDGGRVVADGEKQAVLNALGQGEVKSAREPS